MPVPAFTRTQAVKALQTAASVETIAHSGYLSALPLRPVSRAPALVRHFNDVTARQHFAHLEAINSTLTDLGAAPQFHPDLALANELTPILARVPNGDLVTVVDAALYVEQRLLATHVAFAMRAPTPRLRALFGSIAGVEAQHVAVLLQTRVLVNTGHERQIQLPPPGLISLPAAAATAPLAEPFAMTHLARPYAEGAVGG
jgi:hypothetical protein